MNACIQMNACTVTYGISCDPVVCLCNNLPQLVHYTYTIQEGEWGIQSNLTGANDSLVTYPCPPQYCQCFENSNQMCNFVFHPLLPDAQCHCSRKGKLYTHYIIMHHIIVILR